VVGFFAGVFVALACALLGVFLILRRDAMIGHGLAHILFAGVALGLLLNVLPLLAALVLGILAAIALPRFAGSTREAKINADNVNIRNINTQWEMAIMGYISMTVTVRAGLRMKTIISADMDLSDEDYYEHLETLEARITDLKQRIPDREQNDFSNSNIVVLDDSDMQESKRESTESLFE